MAELSRKTPESVPGKYYVDLSCICCGICTLIAPKNFMVTLSKEYGYLGKQPENSEEKIAVDEAILHCPVNAIGADGTHSIYEENEE
ncbi:MAG: ferredoxin [Spirochaetales bacterium]|nr:ferredoxin [Spirochaetales bacterium]